MTMDCNPASQLGENHMFAKYSDAEVARAKRLIEDAPKRVTLQRGEVGRIASQTGLPVRYIRSLVSGERRPRLKPEPAE